MDRTPQIFDQLALRRHRQRARSSDLFLHEMAVDEVQDRLSMVNRSFTSVAVVTGFPNLWRKVFTTPDIVSDSDTLDLAPAAHDLIVHAMCLHWANDPVGQIIQCRRALRPDGLFLAILLGGQTLHELRTVLAEAESKETGGLSPRVAPMAEIRDLGALLQRSGLALPVADGVTSVANYKNMTHLMHDLRGLGETNALSGRLRHPTRRTVFDKAESLYREAFETNDGTLPATFELICLTGWAPDASQPKALRPGSAQASLADALNTTETKLPD